MTLEALGLVNRLLYEDRVTFTGAHYEANGLSLTPRPLQKPIPTYLATTTPGAIRYAARNGHGVMAGPPFPIEQIKETLRIYREASGPEGDPRFTMALLFRGAAARAGAGRGGSLPRALRRSACAAISPARTARRRPR